ncbi:hypothetical protein HF325_001169 [Metschnikowia pulcherrima]|uniref:Uncharacterized protein n=1 Tax=Metschnikowia pulcherrima TaxID=27326 RepID=A0A8H7GW55_9ASCO|nr:hypothetical protein HF325_001169 [Metschnikowia pulcherrima]
MRDVCLRDEGFVEGPASKADILTFLQQQVEELILEAAKQLDSQVWATSCYLSSGFALIIRETMRWRIPADFLTDSLGKSQM